MKGRPKKAADKARTDILRIRLTEEERAILNGEAQRRGLETSTWARMLLLEFAQNNAKKK